MTHEAATRSRLEIIHRDLARPGRRLGRAYWLALAACGLLAAAGAGAWAYQIRSGLQVSGLKHPVMWGLYITTFVFWIGIAHSGTLISAVLYLFRARWRAAISRAAEAMTVFAVMTAGLFPLIHLGRSWYFYWLLPYPNQRHLWVNFRSPLVWDLFAIGTYFTVSVLFFYLGLVPDLAALGARATGWRGRVYRALALGWRGALSQWHHFKTAYLLLAALATPLVVSVHSVVSWDFAMSVVPGWHSTIFAPYFVAGAIFSGLAMVVTLIVPARALLELDRYVTVEHLEAVAKLLVVTSLIVTYAYALEWFFAWYSENPFEQTVLLSRATGPYAPLFWTMVAANSIVPLSLFSRRVRRNTTVLFFVSLAINVGMWLERFVIIVGSLSRDYNPAVWDTYWPTWVEWTILAGSFGWFLAWFLLFVGHLPPVPVAEVKEALESEPGA
jgi:Ni/Fe-hydrogenase subunit HybB-like protein